MNRTRLTINPDNPQDVPVGQVGHGVLSRVRIATAKDQDAIAALEQNWAREGSIIGFEAGEVGGFGSYLDSSNRSCGSPSRQAKSSGTSQLQPTRRARSLSCRLRNATSRPTICMSLPHPGLGRLGPNSWRPCCGLPERGDSIRDRLYSVVQRGGNHAVLRRPWICAVGGSVFQRALTFVWNAANLDGTRTSSNGLPFAYATLAACKAHGGRGGPRTLGVAR